MFKFKNLFLSLLFVFVLFQVSSVFSIGNVVSAQDEVTYGDVNGDENINSIDFALMRQHILGVVKEFDNGIEAADVDGNGEFNSIDFAFMRKYLLGFIADFPANENPTPTPTAISEYEDGVIDSAIVLEEDKVYSNLSVKEGASLDLNGYAVAVEGDFSQSGDVNINSGTLKVEGDYIIEGEGLLQMTNEDDYVFVGGDFITSSGDNDLELEDNNLTAGVMEVKGDFCCRWVDRGLGRYVAKGSHKVILSGNDEQVVYNDSGWLVFNELEITNETGVRFDARTPINYMQGNYKVLGEPVLIIGTIAGDVVIDGNLTITDQEIDLAGHNFTVTGNFNQISYEVSNIVKVNKGSLKVYGDYYIGWAKEIEFYDENIISILEMTNEEDYVFVGGDFITSSGNNDLELEDNNLTAGVMEVKGDFCCRWVDRGLGRYVAKGSHKVILSGNDEQVVYNDSWWLVFNELEITNETGVRFDSRTPINYMKGNYKVLGEPVLSIGTIAGDVVIDGNLTITDQEIDLAGHNFTVTGNFNQICYEANNIVKVNKGSLKVYGDYYIGWGIYDENIISIIQMTNEEDYVYVGGDFTTYSGRNDFNEEDNNLTAGVMEVKGDFKCERDDDRFGRYVASGSHKVVLSGNEEQLVSNKSGWLVFNKLEITNEKGVRFDNITPINIVKGNYKVLDEAMLRIGTIDGDVSVDGNLTIVEQEIDLNGYELIINGNLEQFSSGIISGNDCCKIKINGGSLLVAGDYRIGYDTIEDQIEQYGHESILEMTNEDDYVFVGGDFITASRYCYYDYKYEDGYEYLSAGVLEVKGNFDSMGFANFVATGSHKLLLSGSSVQVINNTFIENGETSNSCVDINELEIRNKKGVEINSKIGIRKLKGDYKVIGELKLVCLESPILGDVTIDGDLTIQGGLLDLDGHELNVTGNLIQDYNQPNTVKINGGRLNVYGDYTIEGELCREYSILEMTNEDDYVFVGGDFTTASTYCKYGNLYENITEYLSAGVLEVKGNFCSMSSSNFIATGSHKLLLSGSSVQIINNTFIENGEISNSGIEINELEIRNEKGVEINSEIVIRKLKGNYKVIGGLKLICTDSPIMGDVTIDCDLTIVGGLLDLNGYELKVTGDLTQEFYMTNHIKINSGKLIVSGDYIIQSNKYSEIVATLQMTNEEDYVHVGGNFTTNSNADHSEYLTAGTLEVKGDFTQSGNPISFAASGVHKTILSGDDVQTINFEQPETSSFNILKLTKPIETGYIFNTTPVWKYLDEIIGNGCD